jgi:hypothetical protein
VDKETVKRLVELGLNALDERLQIHMASGWYALSGDKGFALQQAAFYALKKDQREAMSLSAGLCAEKYAVLLEYLPEAALLVTAGTYGVSWLVGFNKLKQAILLKQRAAEQAGTPAAIPAAPPPAPAAAAA